MDDDMAGRAHELDTVVLRKSVGSWPEGTMGAVVDERPDTALVEVDERVFRASRIPDDQWLTAALIDVPYADLTVVERAEASLGRR
jgi:hypothetical protein